MLTIFLPVRINRPLDGIKTLPLCPNYRRFSPTGCGQRKWPGAHREQDRLLRANRDCDTDRATPEEFLFSVFDDARS